MASQTSQAAIYDQLIYYGLLSDHLLFRGSFAGFSAYFKLEVFG